MAERNSSGGYVARLPLVALAGNPNTGKTTLFNVLTGSRGKVGNYPGVTVERHEAELDLGVAGRLRLVDIPGTYSLSARSHEEFVAVGAVAGLPPMEEPDLVVLVVDATQLSRNLYLALQVLELGVPVVIALNMLDMLEGGGERVDTARLAQALGVPVVAVVATKARGLEALRQAIGAVLREPQRARPGARWVPQTPELQADVEELAALVPASWLGRTPDPEARRKALALWALLSIDQHDELVVPAELRLRTLSIQGRAAAAGRTLDHEVIAGRYAWIDARMPEWLTSVPRSSESLTDRVDRVLLHPVAGFALFLLLMGLVFQSLFAWADPVISLIERTFGSLGALARDILPAGLLTDLLVEGGIAGVGSVLVFLPQILLLFLFIGLMEDTGYMARVAFLMDRLMKAIGLHGRAFVPMLSGYACAVPAILATRTMERRRDRLLTMMVVPLMTCSARLPVYGLLIAALVPVEGAPMFAQGLLLVAMYLFSTLLALAAAAVLGRTLLKGPRVPLILEMPPYRQPHFASVLRMMWERSAVFLREAGTVILVCTVGMWLLLSFPRNSPLSPEDLTQRSALEARFAEAPGAGERAELEHELARLQTREQGERLRASYGGRLGHAIEPVLEPLGFDWTIGIGLVGAFAAREVFVSTMGVVYGLGASQDGASSALRDELRAQKRVDGRPLFTPLVCLSLMVFFAIACQCMSTLAVVKRETGGWAWPTFLFFYTAALAWLASFVVYQGGGLLGLS